MSRLRYVSSWPSHRPTWRSRNPSGLPKPSRPAARQSTSPARRSRRPARSPMSRRTAGSAVERRGERVPRREAVDRAPSGRTARRSPSRPRRAGAAADAGRRCRPRAREDAELAAHVVRALRDPVPRGAAQDPRLAAPAELEHLVRGAGRRSAGGGQGRARAGKPVPDPPLQRGEVDQGLGGSVNGRASRYCANLRRAASRRVGTCSLGHGTLVRLDALERPAARSSPGGPRRGRP